MRLFFKFCTVLSFACCERVQAQVANDSTYLYLSGSALQNNLHLNRVLVKHHFLCACIESNTRTDIIKGDKSLSEYYLLLSSSYTVDGTSKLFEYEENFRKKIPYTSVFIACMNHYESKELNKFIISLDKYFIKN